MDAISGPYSAAPNVALLQQSSTPTCRGGSPAASPKQLPNYPRRHNRNRSTEELSMPASLHNTPEHKQAIHTIEPHQYRGPDEGGGTSGTGLPGTADVRSLRALQPAEAHEHSPPSASRTSSMKGSFETRKSRSQTRVRRASIDSINEDITGVFPPTLIAP